MYEFVIFVMSVDTILEVTGDGNVDEVFSNAAEGAVFFEVNVVRSLKVYDVANKLIVLHVQSTFITIRHNTP
jgi:hypothetical protein